MLTKILQNKNSAERAKQCKNYFLEKGYLHNDITGWEKIETFDKFNLDPSMEGIPTQLYQDYELKEQKFIERDLLGKKIGTKSNFVKVFKDTYHPGASEDFLRYKEWKNKKDKKEFAEKINKPIFN